MFSYLRPHRRSPSTPTSPVPDQQHSIDSAFRSPEHAHPLRSRRSFGQFSKSPPSLPPSLPPISRVTSPLNGLGNGLKEEEEEDVVKDMKTEWKTSRGAISAHDAATPWAHMTADGQWDRPASAERSQNARATAQAQKLKNNNSSHHSSLPVSNANDLQEWSNNTGRKSNGTHLLIPLPAAEIATSTFEAVPESVEKKKTRRNILNPMSLLARRRTSQAVLQLPPPQPTSSSSSKSPVLYDPSIRGTKVHDFSAPRPRRNVSQGDLPSFKNGNPQHSHGASHDFQRGSEGGDRPWSGGNHTPVFKEDFEEEQYPAAGPHVRKASDLTDLHIPKPPYGRNSMNPVDKLIENKTDVSHGELSKSSLEERRSSLSRSPPSPVPKLPEKEITDEIPVPSESRHKSKSQRNSDASTKPAKAPSQRTRSRGISEVSTGDLTTLHGIPKHMKSTSSRFSFDMIGAAKQEKLLEDRHRQKAAERKAASPTDEEDYDNEGEFDDFDYDGMMDDDGLEERIPGVNADLDDEESGEDDIDPVVGNATGFTFHSMATPTPALSSPMSPCSPAMLPTPRDASGEIIGFAFSKDSPDIGRALESHLQLSPELSTSRIQSQAFTNVAAHRQGLGLLGVDFGSRERNGASEHPTSFPAPPVADDNGDDDDDLYFDDGIIDNLPEDVEVNEFDESIFDLVDTDRHGRPLRPFTQSFGSSARHIDPEKSKPSSPTDEACKVELGSETSPFLEAVNGKLSSPKPTLEIHTGASPTLQPILSPLVDNELAPHPSVVEPRPSRDPKKSDIDKPSADLTHDSLAAYQSALAAAAYKAAANGKFHRNTSPTTTFDERDEMTDHPSLVQGSSRQSEELFSPSYDATYDDFNYDDEIDDDDIIAAANAEALAYDCDGFYGQEFGFYSAPPSLPSASGSSEYIHGMGGYFGPRGDDGVVRSLSGRIAMREPNLTPITERSEHSNRNSMMSLQLQSGRQSLTSPGLAQLAGMMSPYDEENMSLGALMKLRRGAWGGSQASLHSNGSEGSRKSVAGDERQASSSPLSQIPPWQQPSGGGSAYGHARQNSNFSLASDFESKGSVKSIPTNNTAPIGISTSIIDGTGAAETDLESSAPTSPVLMMASLQQQKRRSREDRVKSPIGREKEKESDGVVKHRKTGSADSISYRKEDDPVVGERWVLERRRTAESGEMELLGREVVLGGRI